MGYRTSDVNFDRYVTCRSEYGVIRSCYPSNELEEYSGSLPYSMEGWEEAEVVSLREAAKRSAPWNAFTANICRCKTGCSTRKCCCYKQGISCSSHCHGGRPCLNKKYERQVQHMCTVAINACTCCDILVF